MKAGKTFLLVVAVLIFVSQSPGSGAQNTWQDRPYQQWTISDVENLLTDSPWAQTRSKGVAIGYDNPLITGSISKFEFDLPRMLLNGAVDF